jgi:hypothetical protein
VFQLEKLANQQTLHPQKSWSPLPLLSSQCEGALAISGSEGLHEASGPLWLPAVEDRSVSLHAGVRIRQPASERLSDTQSSVERN